MNLDNFNKWLSLVANFGVVFGILFLVYELNQNTTIINNERQSAIYSNTQSAFGPAAYDRQVVEVLVDVGRFIEENGASSLDTFYNPDHRQFENIVFDRIRLHRYRIRIAISETEVAEIRTDIAGDLLQPGFYPMYESYIEYTSEGYPEFADFLLESMAKSSESET